MTPASSSQSCPRARDLLGPSSQTCKRSSRSRQGPLRTHLSSVPRPESRVRGPVSRGRCCVPVPVPVRSCAGNLAATLCGWLQPSTWRLPAQLDTSPFLSLCCFFPSSVPLPDFQSDYLSKSGGEGQPIASGCICLSQLPRAAHSVSSHPLALSPYRPIALRSAAGSWEAPTTSG